MRQRCNNKNLAQYKDWGGRGITYDPRWESFENFLADMGEPPPGLTLDRRDNDGNYTKENCRWATPGVQRRNSRRIRLVTWQGETHCVKDWAQKLGLGTSQLMLRLRSGMPLERAMFPGRLHRSRPDEKAN